MGGCSGVGAQWQVGVVRGLPSLQSTDLAQRTGTPWCVHIGVYPENMTCRLGPQDPGNSHKPALRTCIDGEPGSNGRGNPVGCGFAFNATAAVIRSLSCVDEPHTCLGVDAAHDNALVIVPCADVRAKGWAQVPAAGGGARVKQTP